MVGEKKKDARVIGMSKIVRYEFLGSWFLFWVFCITVVGIPLATLYLLSATVRIEEDLEDPQRFLEAFRAGKLASPKTDRT